MLFKQLFENESCTYTYMISCTNKKEAVLIDPVIETLDRDLQIINSLGLKLTYAIDTHIHADHVTSASALREITKCKVAGPANDKLKCRDINFADNDSLIIGNSIEINAFHTPGHTDTHFSYTLDYNSEKILFSGDASFNRCMWAGLISNQDLSEVLYNTIKKIFYTMPDKTKVFPAHDYNNKNSSTIFHQKKDNELIDFNISLKNYIQK